MKKTTFLTIKMYIRSYCTCIYNIPLLLNFINFSCYIFKTKQFTTHIPKKIHENIFPFYVKFC